jgi:nicotinate phosphoribosyltransferase
MQQCVLHQYPTADVKYCFKCRNKGIRLGFLAPLVKEQVAAMERFSLTAAEKKYLRTLSFMREDYLTYLDSYRFKSNQVSIADVNGELAIVIAGSWLETILWEVPLLAIVNQLYFEQTSEFKTIRGTGERNLMDKINLIRQYPRFVFADFGTRRRYSADWQRYVVKTLHEHCPQMIGTSNVKLAMDIGIKPIGTMAHEYISAHIALVDNVREAQKRALYVWLQEYGTNLGVALTDTFTTEAFYKDFGVVLANGFSGVRQDSGDPIEFGFRMIQHYKDLGIDPRTKSIVFSDGIDIPKAINIYKEFTGMVGLSFGIGTNLTNNLGCIPLNIVIKLVECNNKAVVKISDNMTKSIGDKQVVEKIKLAYGITLENQMPKCNEAFVN